MVARRKAGVGGGFINKPDEAKAFLIGGEFTIAAFGRQARAGATIEAVDISVNHVAGASGFGTIVAVNKLVGVAVGGLGLKVKEIGGHGNRHAVVVRSVVALDVIRHHCQHHGLVFAVDRTVQADLGGGLAALVVDSARVAANFKASHQTDIDGHRLVDELTVGKLDIQR